MQDIKLSKKENFLDLLISSDDISLDDSITTSVYSAIFIDKNWWGNSIDDFSVGVTNPFNMKLTSSNIDNYKSEVDSALTFLVNDDVASSVSSSIDITSANKIKIIINIIKKDDNKLNINWEVNNE